MIKRVFLLFFITVSLLAAKQYDTTVMAIQAKLFPKIALLEQHIKNSGASTLDITILAIDIDRHAAEDFKQEIEWAYPKGIAGREIVVNVEAFHADTELEKPDAVIVLSHEPAELEAIAAWANENRIVSFTYDPFYLEKGFLVSIFFGKAARPYLNRKVINDNSFVFDHYLLKLSKFYTK